MGERYQSSAKKSTKKFEIVGDRQGGGSGRCAKVSLRGWPRATVTELSRECSFER